MARCLTQGAIPPSFPKNKNPAEAGSQITDGLVTRDIEARFHELIGCLSFGFTQLVRINDPDDLSVFVLVKCRSAKGGFNRREP